MMTETEHSTRRDEIARRWKTAICWGTPDEFLAKLVNGTDSTPIPRVPLRQVLLALDHGELDARIADLQADRDVFRLIAVEGFHLLHALHVEHRHLQDRHRRVLEEYADHRGRTMLQSIELDEVTV